MTRPVADSYVSLPRFLRWRQKHLSDRTFLLILSVFVGLFSACAALLLKFLIRLIEHGLTRGFETSEANYLYLIFYVQL